jgi:energy-coupling factor transporter ATP-binding protein EcfA2
MTDETNKPEAPESFPAELLARPVEARLEYFEQRCLISHPRLQEALEATIQAICPPGEGASTRRPGTMVLVIGPSRVGKTTLIRLLEERLLARTKTLMVSNPSFIPFASILAAGPGTGRFEWADYYRAVLRAFHDPFVDGKVARIRVRELREAMETALCERSPLAIIVDEAHHLAEVARGSRLQSQLNHLKHFENATGVSHILVGTYEMRPFRKVNAQLACRSIDVHFPRYDAAIDSDAQLFRSVVWALQRQLPILEEPPLVEQWEFLYARSIGCIGLLKMHLNRALSLALTEQAKTVTLAHLRQTALSETRVELALRNALESEAELTESGGADERLLTLLGLRGARPAPAVQALTDEPSAKPKQQNRPGKRSPGRDATGQESEEDPSQPEASEEKAG